MLKALSGSACGLNAQQLKVDTITNNLANISTPGYKKMKTLFSDLIHQPTVYLGNPAGVDVTTGNGVRVAKTVKYLSMGDLIRTDRSLDLAVRGEGFFRVTRGGREYYTRDGSFDVDNDGNLVISNGCILEGVQIDPNAKKVMISADGNVRVEDSEGIYEAGTIQLYRFANLAKLKLEGENLLSYPDEPDEIMPGEPANPGYGALAQGFLEEANFNLADEMMTLIEAQRAYGFNSRTMRAADELWSMANNLRK